MSQPNLKLPYILQPRQARIRVRPANDNKPARRRFWLSSKSGLGAKNGLSAKSGTTSPHLPGNMPAEAQHDEVTPKLLKRLVVPLMTLGFALLIAATAMGYLLAS